MTKYLAMVVMAVAMLAAACGDETTVIDGPVPVQMEGPVVNYDVPVCTSDADCGDLELCMLDPAATESVGHKIMVCVIGCKAEMQTVKNEDGTSSTDWVEGSDTCQRFGDTTLYCDLSTHLCKEYAVAEPVVDPTEPDPDVTPDPVEPDPVTEGNTEVRCCYDPQDLEVGLYGVFAYSTSTPTNPEGWKQSPNLDVKEDGCFSMLVDMDLVYMGFWVDLTRGLYPDDATEIPDDFYVATAAKPEACYIGGKVVSIGKFDAGWELGPAVSSK